MLGYLEVFFGHFDLFSLLCVGAILTVDLDFQLSFKLPQATKNQL